MASSLPVNTIEYSMNTMDFEHTMCFGLQCANVRSLLTSVVTTLSLFVLVAAGNRMTSGKVEKEQIEISF